MGRLAEDFRLSVCLSVCLSGLWLRPFYFLRRSYLFFYQLLLVFRCDEPLYETNDNDNRNECHLMLLAFHFLNFLFSDLLF